MEKPFGGQRVVSAAELHDLEKVKFRKCGSSNGKVPKVRVLPFRLVSGSTLYEVQTRAAWGNRGRSRCIVLPEFQSPLFLQGSTRYRTR